MSLINDALKKTQKLQSQQRSGPASVPEVPAAYRDARPRRSGVGPWTFLLGVVAVAVVVVAGGLAAFMMLRKEAPATPARVASAEPIRAAPEPTKPAPAAPAPVVAAAQPSAPVAAPTVVNSPAPAAPATVVASMPTASTPAMAAPAPPRTEVDVPAVPPGLKMPVMAMPSHASATAPAPVAAAATTRPPPPPAPRAAAPAAAVPASAQPVVRLAAVQPREPSAPAPNHGNLKILAFLDSLQVSGVRVAGRDSRVLMNNRVYRVNDMVDYVLGLRLTGVSTSMLTFTDDNGVKYTKSF